MEFLNQLDVNNSKVTEVATPTLGTDVANKDYVDGANVDKVDGLHAHDLKAYSIAMAIALG